MCSCYYKTPSLMCQRLVCWCSLYKGIVLYMRDIPMVTSLIVQSDDHMVEVLKLHENSGCNKFVKVKSSKTLDQKFRIPNYMTQVDTAQVSIYM